MVGGFALALLLLAGCGGSDAPDRSLGDGRDATVLTSSGAWQLTVDPQAYAERIGSLAGAIDSLRTDTGSGWTGRQDDVTGYLASLSGGRYDVDGTPQQRLDAFLTAYGPDLFGVPAEQVLVVDGEEPPAARAEQRLGGVLVLDAAIVVSLDPAGITGVQGRLFPDLTVPPTPSIGGGRARRLAERIAGADATAEPVLVVLLSLIHI